MKKNLSKVTKQDLTFKASDFKFTKAADEATGDTIREISGVAYSGGLIEDHYEWGNLVFDLATTTAKEIVPIYYEHTEKAGKTKLSIGNNISLVDGQIFTDLTAGKEIAMLGDRNFPLEMSVFIQPKNIEQILDEVDVVINGQKFTGPLTVFRNNKIREVSVCGLGADDQTNAATFSLEEINMTKNDHKQISEALDADGNPKGTDTPADNKINSDETINPGNDTKDTDKGTDSETDKTPDKGTDKPDEGIDTGTDHTDMTKKFAAMEERLALLETENKALKEEKEKVKKDARSKELTKFSELNDAQKKTLLEVSDDAFDAMLSVVKTSAPKKPGFLFKDVASTGAAKVSVDMNDTHSIKFAANQLVEESKKKR